VSKATLYCSVAQGGQILFYKKIPNTAKAIKQLVAELKKRFSCSLNQFLFAMEHTGVYTHFLKNVLVDFGANIWLISPLHLSRSLGLQRGKNDKIDSERIAIYAFKNSIDFRPYINMRPILNQVKRMFALRRQLVKSRKQLKTHIQDLDFMGKGTAFKIESFVEAPIAQINEQIKEVENETLSVIHGDSALSRKYLLVNSVMGVGLVLTVKILLVTNEFKTINEPRKMACMGGIAPYIFESGTSVKKQTRVSSMADKELKYLLHMAAMVAIRESGNFKDYYQRKKAEGKHSMKVINAIRNKLIHCIFACVNQDRMYKRNYQRTA
jgi:transposase